MDQEDKGVSNSPEKSSNSGKIVGVILALVVVGGLVFFLLNNKDSESSTVNSTTTQNNSSSQSNNSSTQSNTTSPASEITKEQVAEHSTSSDCWTIVNGKVYDITEYVPRHPGGDEINRACGVDGTSLFATRTTTDGQTVGSGTPHSASAESQLSQFEVGVLKN